MQKPDDDFSGVHSDMDLLALYDQLCSNPAEFIQTLDTFAQFDPAVGLEHAIRQVADATETMVSTDMAFATMMELLHLHAAQLKLERNMLRALVMMTTTRLHQSQDNHLN